MTRHQTRHGGRPTAIALTLSLTTACVSLTANELEIREKSPMARLRDSTVGALRSCQTAHKLVLSGTLLGNKGSIGFEALSQRRPAEFSADFLSPLGNTVAVLETISQDDANDTDPKTLIRCSGNCAKSMGIPAALEALAADDYRNLICGSPAATAVVEQNLRWTQSRLDGVLEWQGSSNFAEQSASTKVTVTEMGSCAELNAPSLSAQFLKIRTELSFGWIFKERIVIDWRGCLKENQESNKLALDPSSLRIWSESKAVSQVDLSIRFHSVEREP